MSLSLKPIGLCSTAEQHERSAPSASVLLRVSPVKLLRRGMICPLSYYIQQNHFLLTALIKVVKLLLDTAENILIHEQGAEPEIRD